LYSHQSFGEQRVEIGRGIGHPRADRLGEGRHADLGREDGLPVRDSACRQGFGRGIVQRCDLGELPSRSAVSPR